MLRRSGRKIDRETLKAPFYSQCFDAAPFALVPGLAADATQLRWGWATPVAAVLGQAAFGWYGVLQVDWFRHHLRENVARAAQDASVAMVECVAVLGVVAALFG